MFCLECGAEMALRARTCPVCGHVYGDRERVLAEAQPGAAAHRPAAHVLSASHADQGQMAPGARTARAVSAAGMPNDLAGRFVLAIALGMAADLVLPWVSVDNDNVTPANVGAPVVVVVALLAAATLPVFTTSLRQHPVWSALPLMVGALCAGIAGTVWLLLAPVTQIFATSLGSDPSNLALSPQPGLYLFMLGAAALLVSGQRMLVAEQLRQLAVTRRDALRSAQVRQAASARVPAQFPVPANAVSSLTLAGNDGAAQPVGIAALALASTAHTPVAAELNGASAAVTATSPTPTPTTDAPPTPQAPVVPVLPGSAAWNQAPAAPTPQRPSPGSGWGKSRGPQRLR